VIPINFNNKTFPFLLPVSVPSSTAISPFTITYLIPFETLNGSVKVALSSISAGLKITISAQ